MSIDPGSIEFDTYEIMTWMTPKGGLALRHGEDPPES